MRGYEGREERQTHEQDKNYGRSQDEWHMEAKQATTPVAAIAAKWLLRRLGGWLHTQTPLKSHER
jgi:hypothetical protein